jgi:L-fuculose-phosphate aldolase
MTHTRKWASPEDEAGLTENEIRELICEIGRRLWIKDMADCNAGNISYRLNQDCVLTTPTLISKGFMEPDDLVAVDMQGNKLAGKRNLTSEVRMHLGVYAARPDVRAIIHAHPRNVLVFAVTGLAPASGVLTEVEGSIGAIALVPYALPGTQAFADALKPYLAGHSAFILSQHGALTVGRGLIEAFWGMETLETYCGVLLAARSLGEVRKIPGS